MPRHSGQKLKILYILDILRQYSDEENPINSAEIIEKLNEYGISAERKAIYADLQALEEYGCDIIKTDTPKKGWFIGSGEFEVPEIYLLCDAVRSAKFISAKKTRELISKLNSMLSIYKAKRRDNVFFEALDKCENEGIYYSIDKIISAIESKKQIKISYSTRVLSPKREVAHKTKEMIINPYALTWQDDYYYLIGNHSKYDNLIHLRLDRIGKVEELESKARHFSEVSQYKETFDTADYTKKLFGMHTGEVCEVEFCCDKSITEQVFDRFSENLFIKKVTDSTYNFTVNAVISEALVTWIINYGNKLKVVKPEKLQQMLKSRVQDVLNLYEE